ncbi:MAG: WhiB family transcriptional regulator [Actinomycetota bacterium]|nr:WhiB family transcriptional regulator [Actinomycetota bacterium]
MNPPSDRWWRDDAACQQVYADLFSPEVGQNPNAAKRVCAVCPVRVACLTDALDRHDTTYGVLGGTTPRERRELLRQQPADAEPAVQVQSAA